MSNDDQLVELATFTRLDQAELAATTLREGGIEAMVPDRGIVGANPFLVNAVGFVRLLVPESALEAARDLLVSSGLLGEGGAADESDLEAEAMASAPVDESIRDFVSKEEPKT
jgi:hypothetical protein